MSDRFDEMAREIVTACEYSTKVKPLTWIDDLEENVRAALRETDAKAEARGREAERRRWEQAVLGVHRDHETREVAAAMGDRFRRAGIRKGALEGQEVDRAE